MRINELTEDRSPTEPLASEADVVRRIAAVVDGSEPAGRTAWVVILDGRRVQLPAVLAIDELPTGPDAPFITSLCAVLVEVLDEYAPDGSVVVALQRTGGVRTSLADRAWAAAIRTEADRVGVPVHGCYLVVDSDVSRLRVA